MTPRLTQPLFTGVQKIARDDRNLYHIVRAYDCIWTMLHEPDDMDRDTRRANARANLVMLGAVIENAMGADAFEADPRQLSFSDAILNPLKPTDLNRLIRGTNTEGAE